MALAELAGRLCKIYGGLLRFNLWLDAIDEECRKDERKGDDDSDKKSSGTT